MSRKALLVLATTLSIWMLLTDKTSMARTNVTDTIFAASPGDEGSYKCPVTMPENSEGRELPYPGNFGNESLSTILGSHIVFKPGSGGMEHVDGSLSMKYMWWRLQNGQLTIDGRRLDAAAPPLRARIPDGYGDTGFQATGLIFPTEGCWEVTGRVGDGSLTFVVSVEKVGDGPCWKEARPPGEVGSRVATTEWVEEPIADSMGNLDVFHASGKRKYIGGEFGIIGSSKFHFLITRESDESATFVGFEQVTGSVNGSSGAFTIRHAGSIENGIARSTWVILDSSRTGELSQLSGSGAYSSGLDNIACYSISPRNI